MVRLGYEEFCFLVVFFSCCISVCIKAQRFLKTQQFLYQSHRVSVFLFYFILSDVCKNTVKKNKQNKKKPTVSEECVCEGLTNSV